MKNLKDFGKSLTRNEMKQLRGGGDAHRAAFCQNNYCARNCDWLGCADGVCMPGCICLGCPGGRPIAL